MFNWLFLNISLDIKCKRANLHLNPKYDFSGNNSLPFLTQIKLLCTKNIQIIAKLCIDKRTRL